MRKEQIILSLIAVTLGIIIAAGAFYFYQSSKKIKTNNIKSIVIEEATPTPTSNLFLTIDTPTDEIVTNEKTIKITGKTVPDAKIVILTATNQEAAVPTNDGDFSTDIVLNNGENIIEISAISSSGESVKVRRVVSYTTEEF